MPEQTVISTSLTPTTAYGETAAIDGASKRAIDMTGRGWFLFRRVIPLQDTVLPATTDVRSGVTVGSNAGSLVVPSAADVRSGTTFDNGTVGTLAVGGAARLINGITS